MRNYKPSEFISAMLHAELQVKIESKTCSKCGHTKSIEDFHKDPKCSDGRRAECKICSEGVAKTRREAKKKERDFFKDFLPI